MELNIFRKSIRIASRRLPRSPNTILRELPRPTRLPRSFQQTPKSTLEEPKLGSQEALKELQNLQKKGSKNRPQKSQVLDQFWVRFGAHFGAQKWTNNEPKNDPKNDPENAPQKRPKKRPMITQDSLKSTSLGPFPPRSYTPIRTCTLKRFVYVEPPRYLKVSLSAIIHIIC